jgi:hypothetical protein
MAIARTGMYAPNLGYPPRDHPVSGWLVMGARAWLGLLRMSRCSYAKMARACLTACRKTDEARTADGSYCDVDAL